MTDAYALDKSKVWASRIVGYGNVDPEQLLPNEMNYRIHPKRQQDALAGSLNELGWVDDVKVNKRTSELWEPNDRFVETLLDGHGRVKLALRKGEKSVPVKYLDLTPNEERLFLGIFDPITNMAEIDNTLLDALLREVNTGESALQELLESMAVDAGLYGDDKTDADAEPQIDKAEELRVKWGVQTGQLWQLGEHRLICGDCTDADVVARVMGGEKADMVFTDPPYNLASENNLIAADVSKSMQGLKDADWDHDFNLRPALNCILSCLSDNATVYVCSSHHLAPLVWEWMKEWANHYSWCVWHKSNPMPSLMKRHWTWDAELIPYATRGKHTFNFPAEGHAPAVWTLSKHKDTDHPTEKPVEVPTNAIRHSSKAGAIVADFFLGSGSTLIACEQLGRKCRAVEISPGYVAVALQRFADATGKTPVLVG